MKKITKVNLQYFKLKLVPRSKIVKFKYKKQETNAKNLKLEIQAM